MASARHVVIRGRVQGVGFRYATVRAADRLGLSGWVRNRTDGAVEALLEGDPAAVDAMVAWCSEGPAFAHVESVDVEEREALGQFSGFTIR